MDEFVRLAFFAEVGKAITSATTLNETLRVVMEQIGNIFAPLNWSVLLRNPKTGELTFKLVIGSGVASLQGTTIAKGRGIAGWVAESGQAIIIKDVANDPRFDPTMDEKLGFKTESIIGVPLKTKERVFGVIELVNKLNGGVFTPVELKILTAIADFTAIAIEKAYYFQALRRIALIDSLTGVNNRRNMIRQLQREIDRSNRLGTTISVLMVDIDKFKEINDSFGHVAGDNVLRHVAQLLVSQLRKVDVVCRYGGDEFVVLMPDTGREQAEAARDRILRSPADAAEKPQVAYTLSVGVYSGRPTDIQEIFKSADVDLYRDKNAKVESEIENLPTNLRDFLDDEQDGD